MASPSATPTTTRRDGSGTRSPSDRGQGTRLRRAERYEALVRAASSLVAEGDVDSVSMEAVAARAQVSRPLVYKYFANRHELLAAVYRREATALDGEIVRAVEAADGFEDVLRAMVRGILAGVASRGRTFTTLQGAGARDADLRREQRDRDRRTVRFFARRAMAEFDLSKRDAVTAVAILLAGIDSVITLWCADPTPRHARRLEDLYVDLVFGGLSRLGVPAIAASG